MSKTSNRTSNKQQGKDLKGKEQPDAQKNFAIPKENYKLLLIGFAIIVLGFILMTGGGSSDPNEFNEDALFSFRRITLSTLLVLFGFAFEIYAIMKRPKNQTKDESQK